MRDTTEKEFKFEIPAEQLEAVQAELQAQGAEGLDLRATYLDTPDASLAAAGLVLRLRQEGNGWIQTAKASGSNAFERLEHNAYLGAPEEKPQPDIGRHDGTPVGGLIRKALNGTEAELQPTFSTQIRRVRKTERHWNSEIEIALDVGQVVAPPKDGAEGASSPVRELELELVNGNVAELAAVAKQWQERHRLFLGAVSKAGRGERLIRGNGKAEAVKASEVPYPRRRARLDGADIQRLAVSTCLAQVLPNAAEVAGGNRDHDIVHQLRVGIRRLRTVLRDMESLRPGAFRAEWEAPLKQCFDALGKTRDQELLETKIQPDLEKSGAPKVAFGRRKEEASLAEAVRAAPFQAALLDLMAFCADDDEDDGEPAAEAAPPQSPAAAAASPKKARKILAGRLDALHRKVVRGGKAFESLSIDDQHRVRKRLKRLRYLAEFVGPLFARQRAGKYIQRLTPSQDALGNFNDKHVAVAKYRARTEQDPRAWFAVGWLSATESGDARKCRKALADIREAPRFWK